MKRILLIFALTISLVASSQTQNFTGVKTFISPPKFKNLIQNDLNTKILTLSASDVLQWKNASSLGSTPNIESVLTAGNVTTKSIVFDNAGSNTRIGGGFISIANANDDPACYLDNSSIWFRKGGLSNILRARDVECPESDVYLPNKPGNLGVSVNNIPFDASGNVNLITTTAPLHATDTGRVGEIRVTPQYLYVCIATNVWVRVAVSSFDEIYG
ncbi:TPA: hypothetical protein ACT5CK_000874 [Flavobacterium psychrophilum]|uniref:hypothetical protein n=1 Tax=Flavobacterium psychrophilum TaxID=96345 RepID=UPI00073E646F|nr:hypothetical protein [Flavobacterium psychrophilum]SNB97457.1 exported hypothetical protein [Flavobacterium psychrophilum]GEJ31733.1 hypothetical protein FPN187_contig00004-0050 [Flavobacterium psychrophilum]GEJ32784.1 hypothetical protein FPN181_contig00069-0016 [Flavobacterium psychrophilum]GEJ40191.1 hypothetical protein FPN186_contig00033-0050 [Flavobacterium psychrophilum]GEJ40852.1 hypothetical protein FPN182_contig00046-0016 [Flavobacterium psychrophilum]